MMYGLEEKLVADIISVFAAFPEVDEVILYGSRAKGNHKPGSDIDLVVKGRRLSLSVLNDISMKLDELYVPYTFDLSIFSQIDNPELIDHIERLGVAWYKR